MQTDTTAVLERQPRRRLAAEVLALGLLAALVVPMSTFAGKAGGAPSTTPFITLSSVDGDAARSLPTLGSSVTFATGYPNGTKNPWVSVLCYQDGAIVYGEGGKSADPFHLGGGSSDWLANGGGATCKAELGDLYWRGGQQYYTYLAETWFDAGV